MKLPPVWWCKSTTPVKGKTSAPAPDLPTSCAALTGRGLLEASHTGSRERGGGLRQTLDRQGQQRARLTVGDQSETGTVWATPLGQPLPALARVLAVLRAIKRVSPGGVTSTQAAWCRGA
ncbi:MAG TPA: hypothetical protein VIY29_20845 [Ktedonobacteraceae bacterium]